MCRCHLIVYCNRQAELKHAAEDYSLGCYQQWLRLSFFCQRIDACALLIFTLHILSHQQ